MNDKLYAVLGGTFDPPHYGHLNLANAVLNELHPDKLLIIPTFDPIYREQGETACAEERLKMSELAFKDLPNTVVSDSEVCGNEMGFTADTLRKLMTEEPDARYILVIGEDKLENISEWYDAEWIFGHADVAVLSRGIDLASCTAHIEQVENQYDIKIKVLGALPINISSSKLRQMLPEGKGSEYIPVEVMRYILRHKLYDVIPDADWLRASALTGLGQHRLLHTLGCEYEAIRLAERWGADVADARIAAVLHDCTKNIDYSGQLKICEEYGITVDNVSITQYKLLHAITGAAVARKDYAVNDAVYEAIRWHTTGKPDMNILEKVIYIADFIEPGRNFEGVETVRRLAYKNIDKALAEALKMSLAEIRSNGVEPHRDTIDALEYLSAFDA